MIPFFRTDNGGAPAAFMAAALLALCSCGSEGGGGVEAPKQSITHAVPSWIMGNWKPLRLFMGDPVEEFDMILTVSTMKVDYRYPDCSVSGRLIMDPKIPLYAANYYKLAMDTVFCPQEWDIPTFKGQEDNGKIWAEPDGSFMYRISDKYWEPLWIYMRAAP